MDTKHRLIQEMWLRGAKTPEIANAIGGTVGALRVEMHRMRRDGWDLPYRNLGAAGKVAA